ncbi:MAG: hypothetical protein DRJ64_02690 [Thermoprotei archaeon]|nr:MAG: hypothetical protein DRJ64_02690 [Thermoprotei archaeon]
MNIQDINSEARKLVDATSASYIDTDLLRRCNTAYEEVVGTLIALDTRWKFGDSNFTSLPTGTQNLVDNQREYSFDSALLTVESVSVMDENGDLSKLTPLDLRDIEPIEEYMTTNGKPLLYGKRENKLLLFPKPATANVTTTNGLKVVFQRTADLFTSSEVSTGTKEPGFASPFHILLPLKMALPYAVSYKKDRVNFLMAEIVRVEKKMIEFYSQREQDVKDKLGTKTINFR